MYYYKISEHFKSLVMKKRSVRNGDVVRTLYCLSVYSCHGSGLPRLFHETSGERSASRARYSIAPPHPSAVHTYSGISCGPPLHIPIFSLSQRLPIRYYVRRQSFFILLTALCFFKLWRLRPCIVTNSK